MSGYYPGGLIISFEGLDCCFKETNYETFVSRLLANHNDKYVNIFTESFPRYGKHMCIPVEKWLSGELDRNTLSNLPYATSSLYALDRMDYWHGVSNEKDLKYDVDTLYKYKQKNKRACFVFDRYSMSNIFYNSLNGDLNSPISKFELEYEENHFGVPKPDIMVWMRSSSFLFIKNQLAIKQNKDENELNTDFLEKVWWRSESIINHQANIFREAGIKLITITINNGLEPRSREEIANEVEDKIYEAVYDIFQYKY